jgi:hypothetical protein
MSARREPVRVPVGPLVAAIGAVMLLVSLFLNWYEDLTAFTVFELVDIVLVVCALLIVVQLAGGMGLIKPPASPAVALIVALFALTVVLTQLVNDPPAVAGRNGPDRDIGIWIAMAGTLLMAVGALLATAQISLAIEPRQDRAVDHEAETVARPESPRPGTPRGARPESPRPGTPRGARPESPRPGTPRPDERERP